MKKAEFLQEIKFNLLKKISYIKIFKYMIKNPIIIYIMFIMVRLRKKNI